MGACVCAFFLKIAKKNVGDTKIYMKIGVNFSTSCCNETVCGKGENEWEWELASVSWGSESRGLRNVCKFGGPRGM